MFAYNIYIAFFSLYYTHICVVDIFGVLMIFISDKNQEEWRICITEREKEEER